MLMRYPGGKGKLSDRLIATISKFHRNNEGFEYREPFFGAGAIGLRLLEQSHIQHYWFNDIDPGIFSLWHSVKNSPDKLLERVDALTPSVEAFYEYKDFLKALPIGPDLSPVQRDYVDIGFKKLSVHQLSFSGLGTMSGGPLGGSEQKSDYKVDCRWSPKQLRKEVNRLSRLMSKRHEGGEGVTLTSLSFEELLRPTAQKHFIYCLPDDELVRLENDKLTPIGELHVGEKLFGNRTVLAKFDRKASEVILDIKVQGLPRSLRLSKDHRVARIPKRRGKKQERRLDVSLWSSRQFVESRNLQVGDYLLIPLGTDIVREPNWVFSNNARRGGIRKQGLTLKDTGNDLWWLLGIYAAEGHIHYINNRPYSTIFSFDIAEKDTLAKNTVVRLEKCFGVEATVREKCPHPTACQVQVDSAAIAEFFSRYVTGVAINKQLSSELMTGSPDMQMSLLQAWLLGDGGLSYGTRNRAKLTGTSASFDLAEQMYRLALRSNLKPSFKRRESNYDVYFSSGCMRQLGYEVSAQKSRSSRRIINGHLLVKIRSIDEEQYDGTMVDIHVSGDNVFAAPYVLVHNCDPPYYVKGPELYQFSFEHDDHVRLAEGLALETEPWLLSYDDCPQIRELYKFAAIEEVALNYTMNGATTKTELLIAPKRFEYLLEEPKSRRTFDIFENEHES